MCDQGDKVESRSAPSVTLVQHRVITAEGNVSVLLEFVKEALYDTGCFPCQLC